MNSSDARRLFAAHAATYDRVNSIISLGLDARWREWAARRALTVQGARFLDAFAGTGRVGLRAAELGGRVTLADVSPEMLAIARRRASKNGLDIRTVVVDLTAKPPEVAGCFDAITVMWGLRYVDDPEGAVRWLSSLIATGGRVVIVDFIEPLGGLTTRVAAWYFFRILPWIAGALAGRRTLYHELVKTTHAMGSRQDLLAHVQGAGLEIVEERLMGFGLVLGVVAIPRRVDTCERPCKTG